MPSFGDAPLWQSDFAQFDVKIGWTAAAKETLAAPHVQAPATHV